MDTRYDFGENTDRAIVYVRPVNVDDLPQDMREQVRDLTKLYAVHNEEGERLALVEGRDLAFQLARQNNMEPVTVH
ncbi:MULTISPECIES: DUF1150 family protein [unclassified Roseovarius]|jgi:hypothetical protein|uniref:DUF1150 family protein n=1 Tax=unclassified Roseovarius TaxID=2614913 RepID=UPI0000687D9E|nr:MULTISPECIES: DUF1150 family protein [unclassified Roseovarius]EAQ24159.1 hypothetical protein ROS217_11481 [Roseovarius sp. 217]KJS40719.1 MAG: hypothetical protein VR71_22315 [Roseovarius sp. BRH_c41]